jgi:dihydroorotate dehydrogenase
MNLLGIEFGRIWASSGARNFFDEGWPHHRYLGPFKPDFRGSTFITKTCTLEPRAGNMPMDGTTPRELFPKCIEVDFRRGVVLNAVGLSNPGIVALLRDGRWYRRTEPFVISLAAVGITEEARRREFVSMAVHLQSRWQHRLFAVPFAIEFNASCPNVTHDAFDLIAETREVLGILRDHLPGVPFIVKINCLVEPRIARKIAEHPACTAIALSNTIPWAALDELEATDETYRAVVRPWRDAFGAVSPLAHLGGGGLSGRPLQSLVTRWLARSCAVRIGKPIIAGGGILTVVDARYMAGCGGVAAVSLGSVAILRPWRVRKIIHAINTSGG